MKRLTWNEYFMSVAILASKRSRDPHTQVGACIERDNKILSTGYNGMPRRCDDRMLPLEREGDYLDTKYPYIVHAELNAILNSATSNLESASIYTTLFPCAECTKAILQAGIKEVYYLEDKYPDKDTFIAAKRMLDIAGVKYTQISVDFDKIIKE